ncbi:MAG: hypothetical protein D6714_12625 [Bacteroidetes bacterium]|nr:MAG: hypothetical protein D6714_12625 [Bacteroidota bacterium]
MKYIWLTCLFFLSFQSLSAQEDAPPNWALSGYVKDLQSVVFFNKNYINPFLRSQVLKDDLLHNRLNFSWFPTDHLTFKAEMRNRFFWGDQIRFFELGGASYADVLDTNNDFLDLSFEKSGAKGLAFQSMLDRLYFEYNQSKWEIRLGRQRVNWGINTFWNPNDIFNAYSFIDFDYEERPGSDALRVRYFTDYASSLEVVVKAFDQFDKAIFAGLWKFNKWNYDFQILSGYVEKDWVLGIGWAGNLKDAGFKGEMSYFDSFGDEDPALAITFGVDYMFSNALYLNGGFLYNRKGSNQNSSELLNFELSAKNLYPYRYTGYIQAAYPIYPLLNAGLGVIYSPGKKHALFLNPTLTWSLTQNVDLDFVGQLIFEKNARYESPVQALFLRTKLSF